MSGLIMGLDPGPVESAFVVWDGNVTASAIRSNNDMLRLLASSRRAGVVLVIEKVESFGMAVGAEVFETVFWSGRFAQAWEGDVERIGRREVKLHLCGSARAKDANIRQALIDRLGPVGTKKRPGPLYGVKSHVWAALAVAVTAWDKRVPAGGDEGRAR